MYTILKKSLLAVDTYMMKIHAPRIAKSAQPGQFVIVIADKKGERIPLTISDYDTQEESITLVIKAVGHSTKKIAALNEGEPLKAIVGPLGNAAEWIHTPVDELKKKKFLFIGGGVGIAPIYPQVKWLHENGIDADVLIGARTRDLLIFEDKMRKVAGKLYVTTDDDSGDTKGLVTDVFRYLVTEEKKQYDEVVTIGPMIMMKFVVGVAKEFGIHSIVSLNALMLDGTGMCGACRVTVGGKTRFTCVDGPEFEGALVDFDEALRRQGMGSTKEGRRLIEKEEKAEQHVCHVGGITDDIPDRKKRIPVRNQAPLERIHNFDEVCYGYNAEEAILEARRCLQCKKPLCIEGCPVKINIPQFIREIAAGEFEAAAKTIDQDSALPAVCGRVCPQENQCEYQCVLGKKHEAIAIGKLERFVADWSRENGLDLSQNRVTDNRKKGKVAIIGSGPAGITCAKELLSRGHEVTIFEALHRYGGVLTYGIPSFRLPKEEVVEYEIENVRKLGAHFENNIIIGRTVTIDDLFEKEGFDAVFIGSGAGLPNFMNIPGENLNGVVSANEFLTRNNLLSAYKEDYDTPSYIGKNTVVIGGGNVAMDAARTALRLGSKVSIVYRRGEEELPARLEEVEHAKEEGVEFFMLSNPVEMLSNGEGWVNGIRCVKMQLGEADASGRRRSVPIEGTDFIIDTDFVIVAIGTSANPLIAKTTTGLEIDKWGAIVTDKNTCLTTRKRVYAGGDAVGGDTTVIMAMGDGKIAGKAIDEEIRK